jgi:3-phosphoshikimate 1-carboxyvinyltransferase
MCERPVKGLVDALMDLGANIEYVNNDDHLPLFIRGKLLKGGKVTVDRSASSQFISALMLAGPFMADGIQILTTGKEVSGSYIDMTFSLMRDLGFDLEQGDGWITVNRADEVKERVVAVEKDWSAAAFWYELCALMPGSSILLNGLALSVLQGDDILPELFEPLGVSTRFNNEGVYIESGFAIKDDLSFDFTSHPDIAMPVIMTCAGLKKNARFIGLDTLPDKESDRLAHLRSALDIMGCTLHGQSEYFLDNSKAKTMAEACFETGSDHRIIMSLAPLSAVINKLQLLNPEGVVKSYPEYWNELNKLGFEII